MVQISLSGADEGTYTFSDDGSGQTSDQIGLDLPDLRSSGDLLDLDRVSLSSQASARSAIAKIDLAINAVSAGRGKVGALINRMTHSIAFSQNEIENMTASESTIRDTDIAQSASDLARHEILTNTSTVMFDHASNHSRPAPDSVVARAAPTWACGCVARRRLSATGRSRVDLQASAVDPTMIISIPV
jgi:flagellin-like hook-associated protein FlgL